MSLPRNISEAAPEQTTSLDNLPRIAGTLLCARKLMELTELGESGRCRERDQPSCVHPRTHRQTVAEGLDFVVLLR
jgi:hypothetical protein